MARKGSGCWNSRVAWLIEILQTTTCFNPLCLLYSLVTVQRYSVFGIRYKGELCTLSSSDLHKVPPRISALPSFLPSFYPRYILDFVFAIMTTTSTSGLLSRSLPNFHHQLTRVLYVQDSEQGKPARFAY